MEVQLEQERSVRSGLHAWVSACMREGGGELQSTCALPGRNRLSPLITPVGRAPLVVARVVDQHRRIPLLPRSTMHPGD